MAIIPSSKYTLQIDTSDPDGYPQGKAQNVTTAGDGTGTPLEQDWVNDLWGFLQALLDRVGITPSGDPDKVGTSDYLDALDIRLGTALSVKTELYNVMGHTYDDSGTDTHIARRTLNQLDYTGSQAGTWGMSWANDGLDLFLTDGTDTHRWTTTTPYDLASLSHNATEHSGTAGIQGIFMRNDGLKMYLNDAPNDYIEEYDVSPAYDLSGVTLNDNSPTYTAQTATGAGFTITGNGVTDGKHLFLAESDDVYRYTMATAWDITTMSYDSGQTISVGLGECRMVAVSEDGTRLIAAGDNTITQWTMSNPFSLTSATEDGSFAIEENTMRACDWAGGGARFHFAGNEQAVIQEVLALNRYI